jgi:type II pantothenate kinase
MSHFCLLRDPDNYLANDWDLVADQALREYWLDRFREHFDELAEHAAERYGRGAQRHIGAARAEFLAAIDRLRQDPASAPDGRLDAFSIGRIRQRILRRHSLPDAYQRVKRQANEDAMVLYPQTVQKLHAMADDAKWLHLIKSVFAGNLFDLGIPASARRADAPTDFLSAIQTVKPRPWLVDHFDRLHEDLRGAPPTKWAKAVLFVDNAGSDFVLGVMPLARELALGGTKVVLAANEQPCLNDITADEAVEVVEQLAGGDDDLAALIQGDMFEVVSSGADVALLDLSEVADELNEAARDADLVVLEGMGRAVESNLDARFTTDALHLAMIKDAEVARRVGGQNHDCICKYAPADGD